MELYGVEKMRVKEIFSELGGKICLSVETLVDMRQWDRYTCLSAQFINHDWKLQKWVIKFRDGYPWAAIMPTLNEYNIGSKMHTLTVQGSIDLSESIKEEVQKQIKLPMDGKLFSVQCCSDVICRMVEKGFEEISEIISKVDLLMGSKLQPLWYITTSKLSEALELNESGEFKSAEGNDFFEVPSKEEWEKVRSVCKITERIYEIINGLFEIKRPTANLYLPHLQEIRVYLTAESASSDAFASLVAQRMLEIFNEYWNDTCLMLSMAVLLDPRYKLEFVEFCLSDSKVDTIMENILKIYDGYAVLCDQTKYLLTDSNSDSEEDEEEGEDNEWSEKKTRANIMEKLNVLKEFCLSKQSRHEKPQKSDLELYLEEPTLPWMEHFSVLKWWKDNCMKYPQLSRMARDFLAIPISAATSYDAYYTEPRKVDPTVMSLKPELMNALMCTRSWKLEFEE